MEKFELTILGCGSALPSMRHFASSQILNVHDKLYMIDCGESTQVQMRCNHLKFTRLGHIFISHLHGDHCFGVIGLISTFGLLGRTTELHIYAPKAYGKILRYELDFFCPALQYNVVFHPVDTSQHTLLYEDRSIEVYSIPLRHRIDCCGFLFKEKPPLPHILRDMIDFYKIPVSQINNIKYGKDWIAENGETVPNSRLTRPAEPARSYAYCSDTIYNPVIVPMIKSVDTLYHEATFLHQDLSRASETFHSTALQAALIAKQCGAKKLIIGHFSSRYEDESMLLKEARNVFQPTYLARENLKFEI